MTGVVNFDLKTGGKVLNVFFRYVFIGIIVDVFVNRNYFVKISLGASLEMRIEGKCGKEQIIVCEAEVPISLELVSFPNLTLYLGNVSVGDSSNRSIDKVFPKFVLYLHFLFVSLQVNP